VTRPAKSTKQKSARTPRKSRAPKEIAPQGWRGLWVALHSWRTASVSLLSFSSGLPLGLIWIAIPTWLAREGVDIKIIGLFTLAQAPWSFKFLWSPLMDRYALPLPRLGRKLGWTLATQIALLILTFVLSDVATRPDAIWIIGTLALAIAFASASQDIAIDAYAVEVLEPGEQGIAVGARTALYRSAFFVAGGLAITLAGLWSWPFVFALIALLYLPMLVVTLLAPHSEADRLGAVSSLRAAVYKLADNLAGALVRPFLVHVGFNDFDVGVATATIGLFTTLAGTFLGGMLTTAIGLGHALWAFGLLQILSNLGYVLIAAVGDNRPLMYAAMGFESLTSGMGTGAFGVLLLRMTMKQFSATQYALFSSLFALPRILAGPVTGVMVDAMGWFDFFLFTIAVGIPGLLMLQRFSPLGVREPALDVIAELAPRRLTRAALLLRAIGGWVVGAALAGSSVVLLEAFKRQHQTPLNGFDVLAPMRRLLTPETISDWVALAGIGLFSVIVAMATAATAVARSKR
jgi:PAT family beta-lactamase induction signal transducer AmpG